MGPKATPAAVAVPPSAGTVWLQLGAPVESNTWTKALVDPPALIPFGPTVGGVVVEPATATVPSVFTATEAPVASGAPARSLP